MKGLAEVQTTWGDGARADSTSPDSQPVFTTLHRVAYTLESRGHSFLCPNNISSWASLVAQMVKKLPAV